MSKSQKGLDSTPTGQMSLFEAVVRQEIEIQAAPQRGSLNIKQQTIAALSHALRHAGKSREQIADEMTLYLGEEITVHMINAWVCQSKENHRFPMEYFPAFRKATNSLDTLNVVSQASGAFVLRGPDALRADIRKLDEKRQVKKDEEKALESEKKRLEALLQEVERRS